MSSNDPLSRDVARRRGEKVPALHLAVSGADRAGWQEATNFLTAAVGAVAKLQVLVSSAKRAMPTNGAGSDISDIENMILKVKRALSTAARDAQELVDEY